MLVYKFIRLFRHDKRLILMLFGQVTDNPGTFAQPSWLAEDVQWGP